MKINKTLCVLALLAYGNLSYAHTHVKMAVPADGSVLTASPSSFVLTFSEPARLTALWLQKDSEPKQKLGPLPSQSAQQISIPAPRLTPGAYVLSWRVVSEDGHVMPGRLSFTLAASPTSK